MTTGLRTVRLTEALKDEYLRRRAAELGKSAKGVREVFNDIAIQANL